MAWRAPTTSDLIATLSKAEVDAFDQSVPASASAPSEDLVARTASFVRGFIRRNHHVRLGPAGTLPEGLISPAMDYAAFDVLKRLPVEVGAARVKAREEALLLFEDVASDKVIAYERTLGDVRLLVQCNYSGDEQPAVAADGGEVLISNYAEPGDGATLRPWEATAHIWR
jgi:hypothetical protein